MGKRATFIIDNSTLEKLHDYAYTERKGISEAVNMILEAFLKDKTELLHKEH